MKATSRERKYAKEHFGEVHHTTLNPEGPGVVRIHLIPPKMEGREIEPSVAIINGQDIIPVGMAWSVLLVEFIEQVNRFSGKEVSREDLDLIMKNTCKAVGKVYPFVGKKRFREDIYRIMNAFSQVAAGQPVDEEIGYMTMGEYAPYMKAPHRMDLMVSAMTKQEHWNCNQNCIHCYAAGQEQSAERELSAQEWKTIIDKCRAAGIPQLTFTGGEPTMREDLPELIDYAKWFVTRLNTNGIRLTKEYCKKLREVSLDSVQITFYSCEEEVHNRLVGAQRYQETVEGIKNALEAGLNISINTPLCVWNKNYPETLKFLKELGVIYVTCSGLITTGKAAAADSEELQLSYEELLKILKESVEFCFANGMEISFTSPGWVKESDCQELGITTPSCGACLSNMAVTPGGNVVPCQSWLSGKVLGNMLKDDWKEIWDSEECRTRREYSAAMQGDCPLRIRRKEETAAGAQAEKVPEEKL